MDPRRDAPRGVSAPRPLPVSSLGGFGGPAQGFPPPLLGRGHLPQPLQPQPLQFSHQQLPESYAQPPPPASLGPPPAPLLQPYVRSDLLPQRPGAYATCASICAEESAV